MRKVHLYRVTRHKQFPGDVRIIQALAGKPGHLPLDRAQAGPAVRGGRMLAAAALSVGDGILKRQSAAFLECFFKIPFAQCSAGSGQGPFGSSPNVREGDEPKDAPLLVGGSGQPDGPLVLAPEQGDIGKDVESVDDREAPSVVLEYFEGVVGDGFRSLVVALQ